MSILVAQPFTGGIEPPGVSVRVRRSVGEPDFLPKCEHPAPMLMLEDEVLALRVKAAMGELLQGAEHLRGLAQTLDGFCGLSGRRTRRNQAGRHWRSRNGSAGPSHCNYRGGLGGAALDGREGARRRSGGPHAIG